ETPVCLRRQGFCRLRGLLWSHICSADSLHLIDGHPSWKTARLCSFGRLACTAGLFPTQKEDLSDKSLRFHFIWPKA
ncbi:MULTISPECIES: hypothetical protein, partial [unclassified Pseudomonas]|uniref:hypothetical protein n=1 Tax=unclassified Pseudomonas TaxID=196821 RepID=UPI001A91D9B4